MRKISDTLMGIFLIVFAAIFSAETFKIPDDPRYKSLSNRFMPRLAMALLVIFALYLIYRDQKNRKNSLPNPLTPEGREKRKKNLMHFCILLAIHIMTVILMDRLGFIVSMMFYLFTVMVFFYKKEDRNYKVIIPIAIFAPFAVFILFAKVFSMLLPPGVFLFLTGF